MILALMLGSFSLLSFGTNMYHTEIIFSECEWGAVHHYHEHIRLIDRIYSILTKQAGAVAQSVECSPLEKNGSREFHYSFSADTAMVAVTVNADLQQVVVDIYDNVDTKNYDAIALVGHYYLGSSDYIIQN